MHLQLSWTQHCCAQFSRHVHHHDDGNNLSTTAGSTCCHPWPLSPSCQGGLGVVPFILPRTDTAAGHAAVTTVEDVIIDHPPLPPPHTSCGGQPTLVLLAGQGTGIKHCISARGCFSFIVSYCAVIVEYCFGLLWVIVRVPYNIVHNIV